MNQRFVGKEAGIVDQEFGREVVDAVDDDIVFAENLERISRGQTLLVGLHDDVGIQRRDLFLPGDDLRTADIGRVVQDLPLQIRQVHHIAVDQTDRPYAGRCQIEGSR